MGYKQIDGNKPFLIHDSGRIRHGLRNLPEDSDRILYDREADGSKKNVWPQLILSSDTGDGQDIRLIPEILLKEHGKLPRGLPCQAADFIPRDGNRLNVDFSNIKYVGSEAASTPPYNPPPAKAKKPTPDDTPPVVKKKPVPPPPPKARPKPTPEQAKKAEHAETDILSKLTPKAPSPSDNQVTTDFQKGSGNLTAKKACAVISKYDYEELVDAGFYQEDKLSDPRQTVMDAWKASERQHKADMKN